MKVRVDYAAIGPVTNLASRLCDHAKGGQILISQLVYATMQEQIDAVPTGELSLKGLTEPVLTTTFCARRKLNDFRQGYDLSSTKIDPLVTFRATRMAAGQLVFVPGSVSRTGAVRARVHDQ